MIKLIKQNNPRQNQGVRQVGMLRHTGVVWMHDFLKTVATLKKQQVEPTSKEQMQPGYLGKLWQESCTWHDYRKACFSLAWTHEVWRPLLKDQSGRSKGNHLIGGSIGHAPQWHHCILIQGGYPQFISAWMETQPTARELSWDEDASSVHWFSILAATADLFCFISQ